MSKRPMHLWFVTTFSAVCATVPMSTRQVLHAQQTTAAARSAGEDARALNELLARRVTISLTRVSRSAAIDSISQVAKVFVQYDAQALDSYGPVTLHAAESPLGVVLGQVLEGTGQRISSNEPSKLMITPVGGVAGRDSTPAVQTIHGRVIDSLTGRELSGATIKVAGTKLTGLTQTNGGFTIQNVPVGTYLVTVRLFGYRPAERTVTVSSDEPATVKFSLSVAPNVLAGVVTTAAGQQRKVEVGNDITLLNVDSVMKVAPITSVTDLLETRVPGLVVQHTSGASGDPSRLRLRGAGSLLLNNDPIIIVDGVRVYSSQSDRRNDNLAPVRGDAFGSNTPTSFNSGYAAPSPLDQIDPNSIETVEVFKGPSASALYGSDAANGVIVITTKRGRAGPTHWNIDLGTGMNYLPGDWPENYYRFGTNTRYGTYGLCSWINRFCQTDSVVSYQALNDPRYGVFDRGTNQTAALTISGGVPTVQYSIAGSATGTVGYLKLPQAEQERFASRLGNVPQYLIRPDNYKTWSVSGSLTTTPTSAVRVTLQSSLFNGAKQRSSLQNGIPILASEYISATDSIFNPLGGAVALENTALFKNDVTRITDKSLTSTNTVSLNWQPRPWLPIIATAGLNTIQRTDESYIPFGIGSNGTGRCVESQALCDTTGYYGLGRGTSSNQTVSMGTTMPLPQQHMTLAVGGNLYKSSTADFQAYSSQLAPGVSRPTVFKCPPNSGDCQNESQSTSDASTYGWYVEPRLNVSSRFFVAPGFRLDGGSGGSTSSGSIAGLSAFPKLNFSWLAVDRQDQPPLWGVISQLRPRVAFGLAGTQPSPEMRLRLLNFRPDPILDLNDSTQVPAVYIGSVGNTQLRPERSTELEGGFDATLWQDRLTLTYTEYRKNRRDAILSIPTAPSLGNFNDIWGEISGYALNLNKNIGDVRNTGREMTLNLIPIQRRAIAWTVNANLTQDKNVVVRLNPGQPPICLGVGGYIGSACLQRVTPGYPIASTWAQPILSYADANHDNIIEPDEIRLADSAVYVGQETPNYQMNIATDLSLLDGRLSVHGTFAYTNGLTQFNEAALSGYAFTLLPNAPGTTLATQAAVVASGGLSSGGSVNSITNSAIGLVQTVNTLRFQDLSINYQVPRRVSTWFRAPRMTVAVQGSNLGLHTNYRGKDPNVNAFSTASGEATRDSGQIPEPRTWWLRINLGN